MGRGSGWGILLLQLGKAREGDDVMGREDDDDVTM